LGAKLEFILRKGNCDFALKTTHQYISPKQAKEFDPFPKVNNS